MDERSIIRWQHRLKRERPTCTERTKTLTRVRMEGWRQWLTRPEKKPCPTKKQQNPLDSDRPSHGRRLHSLRIPGRVGTTALINAPDQLQLKLPVTAAPAPIALSPRAKRAQQL